jgi:hypothetical protein
MRNSNRNPHKFQQNRIQKNIKNSNTHSFFNLLTCDALLNKVESQLPDHRERLYPPTETLSMFLAQAMNPDRSCQNIVNQAAIQKVAIGLPPNSTFTGGYCKARKRLPKKLVSQVTCEVGRLIDQHLPMNWRWKKRRVRLVDGTTVTMPDTPENQAVFPQQGAQKPGLGFPISRLVGVTCLASGALLNLAVGPFKGKGSDEQTLLRSIQNTFEADDIVMGDAFFATYFFIVDMQAKGVDIVMEQNGSRKQNTDFRRGRKLGKKDHLIVISKPKKRPYWMSPEIYNDAPASVTVRELKVGGKILVTTLICPKSASKVELKTLYKSRWNIELDIRNIKDTMGMNILSCKTPDMAIKEIWVYLLAYNLIRLLMAQSALLADIIPRTISFKHCLQLWVAGIQTLDLMDNDQLNSLFILMSQQIVGKRPGRIEPRAVKRRPKAFPLLMKPRAEARAQVRENGHPKKLK